MENRNIYKAADRQAEISSHRLHGYGLTTAMVIASVLFALAVSLPANASDTVDQLRLTGTIKSVNAITGLVTVDVVSSGCLGMRTFKADDFEKLEDYLEQIISFFIDSNTCEMKETYTIITSRGLRK